jgi:hypothetical protein
MIVDVIIDVVGTSTRSTPQCVNRKTDFVGVSGFFAAKYYGVFLTGVK